MYRIDVDTDTFSVPSWSIQGCESLGGPAADSQDNQKDNIPTSAHQLPLKTAGPNKTTKQRPERTLNDNTLGRVPASLRTKGTLKLGPYTIWYKPKWTTSPFKGRLVLKDSECLCDAAECAGVRPRGPQEIQIGMSPALVYSVLQSPRNKRFRLLIRIA